MRSCDEIVELISAGLDGELSADEQTALDEHIACCPACSALFADLRALHGAAAGLDEVAAPAGFAAGVMSAIAADPTQEKADKVIPFAPKKAKPAYWKKWGVTAAAVAIVVLGAVSAPSLLGNFSATKSETADMAPAAFDTVADMAVEAESYSIDMAQEDSINYATADQDASYNTSPAEPVPSAEVKTSTSTAPYDPVGNVPSPSEEPETGEALYVGILMLEGQLESLTGQEGAASSDGTVTYIVTADVFAEVLKELETEKPVGYAYTALSSDAQRGKIIVQSID